MKLAWKTVFLCALSSGCAYVSDKSEQERLDPDNDGVQWPDDCDNNNPEIGIKTWYKDNDGDGFGDGQQSTELCQPTDETWVEVPGDCDDEDGNIHPDADEICDGLDNDCNDLSDDEDEGTLEESKTTIYQDLDNDGFGDPDSSALKCDLMTGWSLDNTDCDDTDELINPVTDSDGDNVNACDDCNDMNRTVYQGIASNEAEDRCHQDADGDGFGSSLPSCCYELKLTDTVNEDGWSGAALKLDVQDYNSILQTFETEETYYFSHTAGKTKTKRFCVPSGQKLEMSYMEGLSDNDNALRMTTLSNGDLLEFTTGSLIESQVIFSEQCVADSNIQPGTDCDDGNPFVHPGAFEICDGYDNDCLANTPADVEWTFSVEDNNGGLLTFTHDESSALSIPNFFDSGTIHLCDTDFYADLEIGAGESISIIGHGTSSLGALGQNDTLVKMNQGELTIINTNLDMSSVTDTAISMQDSALSVHDSNVNGSGIFGWSISAIEGENSSVNIVNTSLSGSYGVKISNDETHTPSYTPSKIRDTTFNNNNIGVNIENLDMSMTNVNFYSVNQAIKTLRNHGNVSHDSIYNAEGSVTADCIQYVDAIHCGEWQENHLQDLGAVSSGSIDNHGYYSAIFDIEEDFTLDRLNYNVDTASNVCTLEVGIYYKPYASNNWYLFNSFSEDIQPNSSFSTMSLLSQGFPIGLEFYENEQMGIIGHFIDCENASMESIAPQNTQMTYMSLVQEERLGFVYEPPFGMACFGTGLQTKGQLCLKISSQSSLISEYEIVSYPSSDDMLDFMMGVTRL